ncbi:hypothetical protein [uncultured Pseudomonas sp.]|uniref:hypothetical protein n=1 Tax=uncultured Pseudomonas sp. TaxID=114707 RepID=UPI002590086E|nr:hypothetical protein [uncultured Pseudomonas sp.]
MPTDVERSFTANLQVDGYPVNVLGNMTTGPVMLASPHKLPAYGVNGTHTLGMLDALDKDWSHEQELGLISFDKAPQPPTLLLYFRYSQAGYRIYLRSGPHFGKGVFTTADGLVNVQPTKPTYPTQWQLIDAQRDAPFDVYQVSKNQCDIRATNPDGHPLEVHGLFPVGGFLACYPAAHSSTLNLIILERGVDWLNPG